MSSPAPYFLVHFVSPSSSPHSLISFISSVFTSSLTYFLPHPSSLISSIVSSSPPRTLFSLTGPPSSPYSPISLEPTFILHLPNFSSRPPSNVVPPLLSPAGFSQDFGQGHIFSSPQSGSDAASKDLQRGKHPGRIKVRKHQSRLKVDLLIFRLRPEGPGGPRNWRAAVAMPPDSWLRSLLLVLLGVFSAHASGWL
ncbi:hypothetical protein GN956_G9122 [Arapaima gigas]